MNFANRFINALDSLFLALIMGWSIVLVGALIYPQTRAATGSVEVYSLVDGEWLASGAGQQSAI